MPGMNTTDAPAIRPIEPGDVAAVTALAARLTIGVAPWREPAAVADAVRGWLVESTSGGFDGVAFVAEVAGNVVGFVSLSTSRHFAGEVDADIGELVVDAAHTGRGLGRALVAVAERAAIERGHRCITLTTGAANERARTFYADLGYQPEDVSFTKVLTTR